jgi:hypothetical protein
MTATVRKLGRAVAGGWNRFMVRRKEEADAFPQNRRRFYRFRCSLPVELHFDTPGHLSIIKAVARDISSGGMRVECSAIPALMSACHVAFRIPEWGSFKIGSNSLVLAQAHVQHSDREGMSFGLAFSRPI